MKEDGMSEDEMNKMKREMEKFKNMSADSLKMMMEKGKDALDSLTKALDKQ